MAVTSTTTKSATGTTITVFNNGIVNLVSQYDIKSKLQQTLAYDTKGNLTSITKYKYDASGKIIETDVYNSLNQLTGVNKFTYTSTNKIDTITHYGANDNITSIDYYVNGKFDHSSGLSSSLSTTTIAGAWSNIAGCGAIDVLKALSDATHTAIKDVTAPDINWALKAAHFDDAWSAGFTGKGIVIANIDTGIDLNNTDLNKHISKDSWNFISNTANVQDDNGHGTFTASEMIASNNGDSIIGGAYDAEIMVLKALNNLGNGTADNIAKAIYYAVDHGADIINLSLNSLVAQPLLKTAFAYAAQHDVLIAASSGNNLSNTPNYPAIYATTNTNVCSVGATFSLNGSEIFNAVSSKAGSNTAYNYVTAGGTNISGYNQAGAVTTMAGTSMAAPLVAAEMAILKQAIEGIGNVASNLIDDLVMKYVTHDTHVLQIVGVQAIAGVDHLMA